MAIDISARLLITVASRISRLLTSSQPNHGDDSAKSIAILVHGQYGDFILLTKLVAQLKAALPSVSLCMVTFRNRAYQFFNAVPGVDVVFYAKGRLFDALKFVSSHHFDILFSPKDTPSVSYLLWSAVLRARIKVAHAHEHNMRGLYDRLIDLDYLQHVTERNAGLLDVLGLHVPNGALVRPSMPLLPVGSDVELFALKIANQGYVGINLSAGRPFKCWSLEKWMRLIVLFPDRRFIVFSDPNDRSLKQHLEESFDNVLASPATANLTEVAVMLRQLGMLVSPDTSLVHMAACYDTPVVALYIQSPEYWSRFAPLSSVHESVISSTDNADAIQVEVVAAAVRRVSVRL